MNFDKYINLEIDNIVTNGSINFDKTIALIDKYSLESLLISKRKLSYKCDLYKCLIYMMRLYLKNVSQFELLIFFITVRITGESKNADCILSILGIISIFFKSFSLSKVCDTYAKLLKSRIAFDDIIKAYFQYKKTQQVD